MKFRVRVQGLVFMGFKIYRVSGLSGRAVIGFRVGFRDSSIDPPREG